MKIDYTFKTDSIDAESGTLFFHTKIPFYLFTKLFNRETMIHKIIYNPLFISEIMIAENENDTTFEIHYDQSRFCGENEVPHRIGMGNSEDILHDSATMITTLRKAYTAAKLSEALKDEYYESEDLQNNISTLCTDLNADKASILNSDCAIGVYESMCKEAIAHFEDEKTLNKEKVSFYQKLLVGLDEFTNKVAPFLSDQLFYLFSTMTPIGVRIRISNILAYSILLNKEYEEIKSDDIHDLFEKEFILQFMEYIRAILKK